MLKGISVVLKVLLLAWLSFTLAVFLHEWLHGLLAWVFGYKTSPFAITYGGFSLGNILWQQVDQNVNDSAIALIGHPYIAGIILVAPPMLINGGLGFLSLWILTRKKITNYWFSLFVYFFMLWNIGEFYSYGCLRSFSSHADVGLFLQYFDLSPWVVFAPCLYLCLWAYYIIFVKVQPSFLLFFNDSARRSDSAGKKYIMHIFTCLALFFIPVYMGTHFAFYKFNPVVVFLNILSLLLLPLVFRLARPQIFISKIQY